jgi:hypothetical protein
VLCKSRRHNRKLCGIGLHWHCNNRIRQSLFWVGFVHKYTLKHVYSCCSIKMYQSVSGRNGGSSACFLKQEYFCESDIGDIIWPINVFYVNRKAVSDWLIVSMEEDSSFESWQQKCEKATNHDFHLSACLFIHLFLFIWINFWITLVRPLITSCCWS